MHNIILNVDSYKASHYRQYPPKTEFISSYIESRGGRFERTVFFGLQMFLKEYLCQAINQASIDEAEALFQAHGLPFYRAAWQHILECHDGRLPLHIQAVPEGSVISTRNVLLQVVNTCPHCYWLGSYIETALLRAIWYPTTVATHSWHCRQIIQKYCDKTSDPDSNIDFKLHDFGARGASSLETAAIGGLAHLVNFKGSDTVSALLQARRYYHEPMAAYSIPAAEHSTIVCWGREEEATAYRTILQSFGGPEKQVAIVSDSYDLWHAIDTLWGQSLKELVIANGGTLIIRPDSGIPLEVVPQAIEKLMGHFGHRFNSKGFKVLPDYLRVIQGDSVCLETIEAILARMEERGLSTDNVSFGMGAELLQKVNRDTQAFAMKASSAKIAGQWRDVYKSPAQDPKKQSKKGRLALIQHPGGTFETILENALENRENLLIDIYKDGELLVDENLATIRERASA